MRRRKRRRHPRTGPGVLGLIQTTPRRAALIPDAPPGAVFTRAAGSVRIEATLQTETPLTTKTPIIQKTLFAGFDGEVRARFVEGEGEGGVFVIEGEVMALDEGLMGSAVEAVMRELSAAAALADAVLEARVARVAAPAEACEIAVADLVRDLRGAGFEVREEGLWLPAPEGEVWVGGEEVARWLEAHPRWMVL